MRRCGGGRPGRRGDGGKAEGATGKAVAKVADDSGGPPPWNLDMSKVMCTNQLAAGAFGKVFHGLHDGDDVAVKLLNVPPDMAPKDLEGLKSSFLQEIAVWHTLSHPNVVQFIGASLNAANIRAPSDAKPPAGQPLWAIVTEYMGGGTLRAHLSRRGKLPPKESVRLALHIARGLCYLHARERGAPRPEVRQPAAGPQGHRQDRGLRRGAHGGEEPQRHDLRDWHRALDGARGDRPQAVHAQGGRVQLRHRAVGAGHQRAAVQGAHLHPARLQRRQ
ncbi:hypothetical protein CLOM_g6331 [Closterium sp. NIES-68]|nr:hypothetical protein CLOM_g6331 [Closterium sp. NIES-68]